MKKRDFSGTNTYTVPKSAQSYFGTQPKTTNSSSCGSSCGTGGGKQTDISASCGSSCSAGDDKPRRTGPCGSSCGTGE